jgi:endonuclease YncB( thermonuclease family)
MRLLPGVGPAIVASILLFLWLAFCGESRGEALLVGVARVVDGDTIELQGKRIGFLDLDAPEPGQHCRDGAGADYPCGETAAAALSAFIAQRTVTCDLSDRERDGRVLARCTVASEDPGLWLVDRGWAVPDRDCKCEIYREAEARAKTGKLGMWAGSFDMPWDWRKAE